MSEFLSGLGEQYPDALAADVEKARQRILPIAATRAATGLVTSVLPDPSGNDVVRKIPMQGGAAQMLNFADFLDSTRQAVSNTISDAIPAPVQRMLNPVSPLTDLVLPEHAIRLRDYLPDAPFDWAARVGKEARDKAAGIVPQVEPNSPEERVLGDVAEGAGSLGIPIPGAGPAINALRGLSKGAGPLARGAFGALHGVQETLLPAFTSARTSAISGGVSGAFGVAAEAAGNQSPDVPAPTDTLPIPPIPPNTIPSVAATATATTKGPATQTGGEQKTSNPVVPPPPANPQVTPAEPVVPFDPSAANKNQVDTTKYPTLDWTVGTALSVFATGLALRYGGRKAIDFARKLTETTRQDLNAPAAARFNRQLGEIENQQPLTDPTRLAAPSPVTALQQARGKTIDANAPLYAYTDYAAKSQTEAELMRDRTGVTNNNQIFVARQKHFLETGWHEGTGVSMPPPEAHFKKVAALSREKQDLFSEGSLYADEMDNRQRLAKENPNTPPEQLRVNYADRDDAYLNGVISQARADPAISPLMDERNLQHQRMAQIWLWSGMVDHPTYTKILADHPNYASTITDQNHIESPLAARELTPGIGERTPTLPVWKRDAAHYDKAMQDLWQNENRLNIIQQGYDKQALNPDHARMFSESKKPGTNEWVAGKDAGGALPVRNNGKLEYHYVHNPALRASLNESPVHTGVMLNTLNHMRNLSQSSTTGLRAAALGHVFALTGAARYGWQIPMTRVKGTYGGYGDRFAQRMTGGRVRFGDPTALITMFREPIAEGTARAATRLSKYMAPGANNWPNTALRSIFGDNHVNALHNTMQDAFYKSNKGLMEREGAANAAGMSYVENTAREMGPLFDRSGQATVSNNMVPELFRTRGIFGSATPVAVKVASLLHTFNNMIGEMAHAQYFRMNDHLPMDRRVLMTRGIVGDPAVRGSWGPVKSWGKAAEYGNIAVQEMDQVARRAMKSPLELAWNATTIFGSAALLEMYSAMLSGKDHIANLENELSAADHTRFATFYIPGQPPENAIRIPLGINISPIYAWYRFLASAAFSLKSHPEDEDVYNWALHGMHDMWNTHLTQDLVNETIAGLSRGVVDPVPGFVKTGVGLLTGQDIGLTLDSAYDRGAGSITKMFTRTFAPGDAKGPNRNQGADALTDSANGNVWKHAIASMFGLGGKILMDIGDNAANVYHSGGSAMDWLGNTMESYKGRLQESVPFMNGVLFNHDNNLVSKTPLVARVDDARNALKFAANWNSDLTWEGYTRSKGAPLPLAPGQAPKVSHDPLMEQMFATAGRLGNQIETQLMPSITDLEKQRNELKRSPLSPEVVMTAKNNYTREIQAKYERVAGIVNQINDRMSALAGKRVTVHTINWGKDSSQFKD